VRLQSGPKRPPEQTPKDDAEQSTGCFDWGRYANALLDCVRIGGRPLAGVTAPAGFA
jgi:hypothetical protein